MPVSEPISPLHPLDRLSQPWPVQVDTGAQRRSRSDRDGRYQFINLQDEGSARFKCLMAYRHEENNSVSLEYTPISPRGER